uniref:PH domain-containing protein n=1 Tax=Globisporangium ultimum (strain ATCC 200006 / CBS 805.95 / DAOM BR144) TaxID=431595 RepID=K3W506_GLOUD
MQLAIPITPPSAMLKAKKQQKKLVQEEGFRASSIYGRFTSANTFAAFSLGPWRESSSSSSSSRGTKASGETSIQDFLASLPIDLAVDVRTVCQPESISLARKHVHHLLQCSIFEIRSTKWAAYFLQIVKKARNLRQITSGDAISLRWVIWCCVRKEVNTRQLKKEAHDQQMQKKMTDYRVALQCIRGATVLKYGRKGKPHQTQLMIENGESLFWTSKLLSHASKKKSIPLASIVAIRAGPTTDVLARALQKGMLALQDAKCTLSLITATRTFDIKAKSTAEREWLHRSFSFLVDLAHEHEKRVAQQVELSIMKRMETLNVWKHGRKGRPHKTRIFINRFGEISWQGRSGDSIQIDEILAIDLGHCTQVFSRSLSSGFATSHTANYCFSLVTRTRTLDIETSSENMRDWFVVAFRYLMDKVKEKTAALKREKAEKQLKLLQELCGSIGILNNAPSSAAPPAAHA